VEGIGVRKIALVGFAPSGREKAKKLPKAIELWTLTRAYQFDFRVDRLFEIHWREMIEEKNLYATDKHRMDYLKVLMSDKDYPIYMQEAHEDIPGSVAYPLEAALELAGGKYFDSTFAYMAAMAMLEKVDQVELIGFEMRDETEHLYQKPNAFYWIGRMEEAGIEVIKNELMPETRLYGWEVAQVVTRHTLELQKSRYAKQADENQDKLFYWKGILAERKKEGKNTLNAEQAVTQYEMQRTMSETAMNVIQNLIDVCDLKETKL